jgi:exodeoxyribonuclease VII large subunit
VASVAHLERADRRLAAVEVARAVTAGLALASGRLTSAEVQLRLLHPRRQLSEAVRRLGAIDRSGPATRCLLQSSARLGAADFRSPGGRHLERAGARLLADRRHLDALSPAKVLERGYAVVRKSGGPVVRRADQVSAGEPIEVQLAAGRLAARVEEVLDDRG